jgi:hypothetical protein
MNQLAATIVHSVPDNLLAMVLAGSGTGVYLFYRGFRLLQRRRLILNTPTSKIHSAAIGLVEVNGLATGPYVITSPIKQVDCFYYRSLAWELRQQGKSSKWVKIGEETLHVPFFVDDGSGTLLIDPTGADLDLHCDFKEQYNSFFGTGGMTPSATQFLSRCGADFSRSLKVEEFCIKPKNFLFVLGTLSQNPTGAGDPSAIMLRAPEPAASAAVAAAANTVPAAGPHVGANYISRSRLNALSHGDAHESGMAQEQMIAAAMMKAGITNPAAWAIAGVSPVAAAQIKPFAGTGTIASTGAPLKENSSPTNGAFDLHPSVIMKKGPHDSSFLISWRSQRDLVGSLAWKSALMIWGGPVLTLVCLYILLANFGWL